MKLFSQCHSRAYRYPTIKAWFLDRFPEIKEFSIQKEDAESPVEAAANEPELEVLKSA